MMPLRRYCLLLLLLIPVLVFAVDGSEELADPVLQARYETLTRTLRCLVCQNQAISDSNAGLASDLRGQVREMLLEGQSDEQIYAYMTDRYGDFVLYKPPLNKETWLLWFAPALFLLLGAVIVIRTIARRSHMPIDPDADEEQVL